MCIYFICILAAGAFGLKDTLIILTTASVVDTVVSVCQTMNVYQNKRGRLSQKFLIMKTKGMWPVSGSASFVI